MNHTHVALWMWFAPWDDAFSNRVLSDRASKLMCWHLLPAPVIGCQWCRVPLFIAEERMDKQVFLDSKSEVVLPHGVGVKGTKDHEANDSLTVMSRMSLIWPICPDKAEFSNAIAVTDRIDGWTEGGRSGDGSQHGGRLAACIWTHSKAFICNGHNYVEAFRKQKIVLLKPLIGPVQAVQKHHDWILQLSFALQENRILGALNYDIEIPCIVQRVPLWYSAPSSLNKDLSNDDVILEMYNRVVDVAVETSFRFLFTQVALSS